MHDISAPVSTNAFVCNPLMDTRVVFLCNIVVRLLSCNFFSLCTWWDLRPSSDANSYLWNLFEPLFCRVWLFHRLVRSIPLNLQYRQISFNVGHDCLFKQNLPHPTQLDTVVCCLYYTGRWNPDRCWGWDDQFCLSLVCWLGPILSLLMWWLGPILSLWTFLVSMEVRHCGYIDVEFVLACSLFCPPYWPCWPPVPLDALWVC